MYIYVQDQREISAMTTVNLQINRQLSIDVVVFDSNEGPIPHVHVYLDKTRDPKNCAVVRLDKAEYSTHHGEPVVKMNKKQKKEFVRIMKSQWNSRISSGTGYERAVDIWVDAFEEGSYDKFTLDDNGAPVMPDYGNL